MVAFLKDPSGPALWEENPEAKDIVHVETEKVSVPAASSAGTQLSTEVEVCFWKGCDERPR